MTEVPATISSTRTVEDISDKLGFVPSAASLKEASRNFLVNLARSSQIEPDATDLLARVLSGREPVYWVYAIEATVAAAEGIGHGTADRRLDVALAKAIRDKPDVAVVAELYNRIPKDTIMLRETALEVYGQTRRMMVERDRVDLHPDGYLTIWLNYIQRLIQGAKFAEAEEETAEALSYARRHFELDPERFRDGLASGLESRALVESALGRLPAASAARAEEMAVLGDMPGSRRELAQCVHNHAGVLKALGEIEESLRFSREAVAIYRQLVAEAGPATGQFDKGLQAWVDDSRPNLGASLIALSTYLNDLKDHEACIVAAEEADAIFAVLDGFYPDQFRIHRAMARHNVGMAKFGLQDLPGGLAAIVQAEELSAPVHALDPIGTGDTYGRIMMSLVLAYNLNDCAAEVLPAAKRCVKVHQDLNEQFPGRFIARLAEALDNRRVLLDALGFHEEAIAVRVEASALGIQFDSDATPARG